MGYKATFAQSATLDGRTFSPPSVVIEADNKVSAKRSGDNPLPAAKTGQLTTRTDNDTGTLTMTAGHGIVTGNRLDVYWVNADGTPGKRYGMTVGTVATNSVPIDGGAGDILPPNPTNVTAQVPVTMGNFTVTGSNALAIIAEASDGGVLVFRAAAADVAAVVFTPGQAGTYTWYAGGGTNPLTGGAVVSVLMSHPSATGTGDMEVNVLSD